jgi:hypothetical protein
MRFARRMTKTRIQTHTHIILCLLLFHVNTGYANSPQCYLIRNLSVLLIVQFYYNLSFSCVAFLRLRVTIYYLVNILAIFVLVTYEPHSHLSY